MASSIAVVNTGIGFAFNSLKSIILCIGAALALSVGHLAVQAGTLLGLFVALVFGFTVILALWFVWRPNADVEETRTSPSSQQNPSDQATGIDLKHWCSAIGAVFGACMILVIGFLVLMDGSPITGLLFLCSGVLTMRAAWTLFWVQRGARG